MGVGIANGRYGSLQGIDENEQQDILRNFDGSFSHFTSKPVFGKTTDRKTIIRSFKLQKLSSTINQILSRI